jgi:hypothetical protein
MMTEPITLNLTLKELKLIDKYVEYNEETKEVFGKIKSAYPQIKMKLELAGKFEVVFYNGENYYRLEVPGDVYWYMKKYEVLEGTKLVFVQDDETHRLLEGLWFNQVKKGKYDEPDCPDEPYRNVRAYWGEKDNPKPVDEVINRMVEKRKSKKLWNMIRDKLDHLGYDVDCCDVIVDLVEKWLPEPQSAAGSQNTFVECNVEGYNDCLREMKEMLR